MAVIKKILKLKEEGQPTQIVCLQYIPKKGKVTLGGANSIKELIWRLYIVCFDECDGEPDFYHVVKGKCRIDFNTSFKKLQEAYGYLVDEGFSIEETSAFGRLM